MSELFRKRMELCGGGYADAIRRQSIDIKEAIFENNINYKQVRVGSVWYDAHFLVSTEYSAQGKDGAYYLEFREGIRFPMGTYVYIPDPDNVVQPWMITSISDNVLFAKPAIQKCNYLLKWQNAHGDIIERYCVLRRPYSSSFDEVEYNLYSNKQYRMLLPLDEETKNLYVDKRFLLEQANGVPLVYALTAYDTVSEAYTPDETILTINLEQRASLHDRDNLELMIADYFDPKEPPTSCYIDAEKDIVRIGGTGTIFRAVINDRSGRALTEEPQWSIVTMEDVEDQFTIEVINERTAKVKVAQNFGLVGSLVKVVAHFPTSDVTAEKIVKVVGIV